MNDRVAAMVAERLGLSADQAAALANGDIRAALGSAVTDDPVLSALLDASDERVGTEAGALEDALRAAHTSFAYIASVLGGCACFGEDPGCERCKGEGAPGWRTPAHPDVLVSWAGPALSRLGYRIVRER